MSTSVSEFQARLSASAGSVLSSRTGRWGLSLLGIGILLVTWELAAGVLDVVPDYVLAAPSEVVVTFLDLQGLIFENLWPTLTAGLLGFCIAVVLSIVIAVPLIVFDGLRRALMPVIVGANSVPRVTLAPLIIFYIGIGTYSNLLIATWIAFFPIFINTIDGLDSIPEETENLMTVIGATTWQEFRYVRFFNALPSIFDGMKVGVSLAMIGAVVGEFVAGQKGLGFLALFGLRALNLDMVIAVVLLLGLTTTTLIFVMYLLQDRIVFWQEASFFATE
ncbi:ABC transporter permease [Natrinema halophilum]|uniref:ABC transporter permease n=1 Tax=Natrinema halophilum TaxID=1699371 RepID=A0A7D5KS58_9EURY|nr:ABC transporter permease [Natrinema halophilum]QLG49997.1 ABC transporter permease [Natrinema halophilum]